MLDILNFSFHLLLDEHFARGKENGGLLHFYESAKLKTKTTEVKEQNHEVGCFGTR